MAAVSTHGRPAAPRFDPRTWAGLFVVWALAWAPPAGLIFADTKLDLYVDPWGFLGRALHAWDPQVTWGVMQNQAYGYLFPMGPFFALGSEVLPVWVVQRLWWCLLLSLGFLGMRWLLRELGVVGWPAILGALAYTLSIRTVTTIAALSTEALPGLVAPLILAPIVRASLGRMDPRRAAGVSGCAVLLCGGVNATATAWAAVPTVIWLLTRRGWWRDALTWWWAGAAGAASLWWLIPLVLQGRFSPPFLDWIEDAATVSAPVQLFDVLRGSTHWLAALVTPAGPWWPAGHDLSTRPVLIVASTVLAALGLAFLAVRGTAHRVFLISMLLVGVLALALPRSGILASPLAESVQGLLDGPLAPLRNIHKADLMVRLALAIALALGLQRMPDVKTRSLSRLRPMTLWIVAGAVIIVASPGLVGRSAPPGGFPAVAEHWGEVAEWLDAHDGDGRSLVVPSSTFAELTWGRPIDEPLRPLADSPYAVRDGVPLTPANTIRLLDTFERELQSGGAVDGLASALGRAGIRYLLLRNDLDTEATGGAPTVVTRATLISSPGLRRVAGFGPRAQNIVGDWESSVEVFEVESAVAAPLELIDAEDAVAASSASDAAVAFAAAGVTAPIIFDGDAHGALTPTRRIESDAYQARGRFFGAARGQDFTDLLSAAEDAEARDYRPWTNGMLRTVRSYDGLREVSAATSIGRAHTWVGLHPENGVAAAVDGDPATTWLTFADPAPRITLTLESPSPVASLTINLPADEFSDGRALAVPRRLLVAAGHEEIDVEVPSGAGTVHVPLGPAPTESIAVTILDTSRGEPAKVLTGLAEVTIDALQVTPWTTLGRPTTEASTDLVVLGEWAADSDGCVSTEAETRRCLARAERASDERTALHRRFTVNEAGEFTMVGRLVRGQPRAPHSTTTQDAVVSVSSVRTVGSGAEPLVDGDSGTAWSPRADDPSPTITMSFEEARTISDIRLDTRDGWARRHRPFAQVEVDGVVHHARMSSAGVLSIPETTARKLSIRLLSDVDDPWATASLEVIGLDLGDPMPNPGRVLPQACGSGPPVIVNGTEVATRLVRSDTLTTAEGIVGADALQFATCAPAWLTDGVNGVVAERWEDYRIAGMTLLRVDSAPMTAQRVRVEASRQSATHLSATIAWSAAQRLLVMDENTNPGWSAHLDGQRLAPQVVDGFRQGFVIPAASEGEMTIDFAPAGAYRVALLGGLILAGSCVLAACWPGRAVPRLRPGVRPVLSPPARSAGVLVLGWLVGGVPGIAVGIVAAALVAVLTRAKPRQRVVGIAASVVAGTLVAASGVSTVGAFLAGDAEWVTPTVWALSLFVLLASVLGVPPSALSGVPERSS